MGWPIANIEYERFMKSGEQIDYTSPLGKIFFMIWSRNLDKEFYIHLTQYQAQINPNDVEKHFKEFKKCFYPHLEDLEARRDKATKARLVKEIAKGPIAFRPVDVSRKAINKYNKELRTTGVKFTPQPRTR